MKKIISLLLLAFVAWCGVSSQTLAEDRDSKRFGYTNANGIWMIAPKFQRANEFQGWSRRFAVVKYDNFWGCIDVKGVMVVRNIFDTEEEAEEAGRHWMNAGEPGKWLYPVCSASNHLWGYVNYNGLWKFQPEYEDAGKFIGEEPTKFAAIKKGGRWGCIDGKGVLVINNVFHTKEDAESAGEQWRAGLHYDTWRMPVANANNGLYGVVNYLGRWMIQGTYENMAHFGSDNHHAYTQAKFGGRWGNVDRNGNVITQFVFNTQEDAAKALYQLEHGRPVNQWRYPASHPTTGSWGWVDYFGNWVIQPMYENATHFANDTGLFATVKVGRYWASIDNTGYLLSQPVFTLSDEAWQAGNEWDQGRTLGDWIYPVMDSVSKQWGFVNYKGEWAVRPVLEGAKQFAGTGHDRFAPAKREGHWGCVDHTGRFVVPYKYNTSADAYEQGRKWAGLKKY
ncbi:MAG: WG repeat-containing protein [Bacteroidales bacterium]|nr:WG repeat-containing protein [Bacteroidales bacterium]